MSHHILLKSLSLYTVPIKAVTMLGMNPWFAIMLHWYLSLQMKIDYIVSFNFNKSSVVFEFLLILTLFHFPDSKIHGANMGPTWVLSSPGGPHDGPMNLAIRVVNEMNYIVPFTKTKGFCSLFYVIWIHPAEKYLEGVIRIIVEYTWWPYGLEILSTLLALCAEKPLVTNELTSQVASIADNPLVNNEFTSQVPALQIIQ